MSATNLTKNLKLPQFLASDKPSWLGDVNGAMLNIDNGYGKMSGDISKANDTASSAKSQSDANTQTLVNVNSELESQGNRITALEAGGGTEQLEQRVNTLSTDVESLQTRADTFEEEIAENGKKITALSGRVTTLETTTKTNSDNITSLQTQTSGFSESIQSLTSGQQDINARLSVTSATATNALTNSNQNSQRITSLSNKVDSIDITFMNLTIENAGDVGNTIIQPSTTAYISGNQLYITPFICAPYKPSTTATRMFKINITANINTNLIGDGFNTQCNYWLQTENGYNPCIFYLTYDGNALYVWIRATQSNSTSYGTCCIAIPALTLNS